MKKNVQIEGLLDLSKTLAAELFSEKSYPWEVLGDIAAFIEKLGPQLSEDEFDHPSPGVWIAKDATVFPSAYIGTPCIIDHGAEVRHCAFVRGSAIIGKNAVVGNSTELKNVILFDGVQVPHYNYVGDSVLGYKAHMGAGSITSNVKMDRTLVRVFGDDVLETNRKKFGAILGDHAEVGCNSVLNPGTVVGANALVYPLSSVRGVVPANAIYKDKDHIVEKK
ncbi:MAG: UDP-N-acetylglucosamine pyrophosphorylase [Oscillospiraceae bacterium]|nr:UDP-N-acetylglucosamine pyrophosphorylase [Oscillospiraceae bacterium]